MRLWISVYLTRLSLDVLCPSWSESPAHGQVILDHDKVRAMTPSAFAMGVRPGMRRGGVSTIAPEATLLDRDPVREASALNDIALCLLQYTPEVAMAADDSLLLDVSASLLAFGGPRGICRRIRQSMALLGFHAQLGMAPTAQGAWLMARAPRRGHRRMLRQRTLIRRMDGLSCQLLPPARPHLDWLEGIGCRTLGALARLPRAGLQRRCGKDISVALDRANGVAPELFDWVVAPSTFQAKLELIERIDHADAVLFVAHRLIQQMTGWLVAQHLAVARIELALDHERGRHAIPPTLLQISLAEPAWHPEHLVRLLKEKLAQLVLTAPVIAVTLSAPDVAARTLPSESLFPEPGGTPADHNRLLELLTARLGADKVLQPLPKADYRPEIANGWQPAPQPKSRPAPVAPAADRPFWLLEQPIALVMQQHRPVYGSRLKMLRGPDRLETGWWDDAPASRDYFIAESDNQVRYWIYRERVDDDIRWFLHGLFA
jgi:protein ImuB